MIDFADFLSLIFLGAIFQYFTVLLIVFIPRLIWGMDPSKLKVDFKND